jgi:hypothetical protein
MFGRLSRAWNAFWLTPVSAKPMGLFRILYSLIVLAHWLPRWRYVPELFSTESWHSPYLFYTWGYDITPPSPAIAYVIYMMLLLAASLFLIGWHTKLANVVLLVCYTYLDLVESNNIKAYDRVMMLEAVAMLVAFPGAAFSLDAWRERRRADAPQATADITRPIYGARLLCFLFCTIYFFAGLKKAFFTPHWWDGGVLFYALLDRRNALTPIGVALTRFPWLVAALAAATAVWELLFPMMVWWRRVVPWWLLGGVLFHLGIQATINVGPFNAIMLATYVVLLPPDRYDRWKDWVRKRMRPLTHSGFPSAAAVPSSACRGSAPGDAATCQTGL